MKSEPRAENPFLENIGAAMLHVIHSPAYNVAWDNLYVELMRKRIERGEFDGLENEGSEIKIGEISPQEREQILRAVDPWVLSEFLPSLAAAHVTNEQPAFEEWTRATKAALVD